MNKTEAIVGNASRHEFTQGLMALSQEWGAGQQRAGLSLSDHKRAIGKEIYKSGQKIGYAGLGMLGVAVVVGSPVLLQLGVAACCMAVFSQISGAVRYVSGSNQRVREESVGKALESLDKGESVEQSMSFLDGKVKSALASWREKRTVGDMESSVVSKPKAPGA